MKHLRIVVTIAILATALLMALSIGITTYYMSYETTQKEAKERLAMITQNEAQRIERHFEDAEKLTDHIIHLVTAGVDIEEAKRNSDYLDSVNAKISPLIENSVELSNLQSGWVHLDSRIFKKVFHISYYDQGNHTIGRADVFDVRKTGHDKDEWFNEAYLNSTAWVKPYYWEAWNKNVITYAKRIEVNKEIIGVAGIEIFLDDLVSELKKIKVYNKGYIALMDENFNVIYHPDPSRVNLKIDEAGKLRYLAEAIQADPDGQGILDYNSRGEEKLLSYQRLSNKWILAVIPYKSEIYKEQRTLMTYIVYVGILVSLLALVSAVFVGHITSRPFIELNTKLKRQNDALQVQHSEILNQRDELYFYAHYDPLTGIYNRRAGIEMLENALELLKTEGHQVSIIFMDIDQLKWVNDHYGHMKGDEMILRFVNAFQGHIKSPHMLCRMGGDEFLAMFVDCTEAFVSETLESIRTSEALKGMEELDRGIAFSYGMVHWTSDMGTITMDEMIAQADMLMYSHKTANRI